MDGNGWNIIEPGGAIALRYPTMRECVEYCIDNNERYVILSPDVTNREAITLLRDIERV